MHLSSDKDNIRFINFLLDEANRLLQEAVRGFLSVNVCVCVLSLSPTPINEVHVRPPNHLQLINTHTHTHHHHTHLKRTQGLSEQVEAGLTGLGAFSVVRFL